MTKRTHRGPAPLSTGIPALDEAVGGLLRGALTEIFGARSSGRSTLLHSILGQATQQGEICAIVDATDSFDPVSAAAMGVDLERVLWVRCGHRVEHALKAADLLLQAGGFGLVVMDLGEVPGMTARRIPLSCWYRYRRAVEDTPGVFLVIQQEPFCKTCASLSLELSRTEIVWKESPGVALLQGMRVEMTPRKPAGRSGARLEALAAG
jgi:recombination protein RecA